jgi:hypothetical protein
MQTLNDISTDWQQGCVKVSTENTPFTGSKLFTKEASLCGATLLIDLHKYATVFAFDTIEYGCRFLRFDSPSNGQINNFTI